jgi:methyl-accepting chemotaxis protein
MSLTVCLVMLGLGALSLQTIRLTTSDMDSMGRVLVPKVAAVGRMHQSMYEAVADLRGAVLATDPDDVQNFLDGAHDASGETDEALEQYQKLPMTAEEQGVLATYVATHTTWMASVGRLALEVKAANASHADGDTAGVDASDAAADPEDARGASAESATDSVRADLIELMSQTLDPQTDQLDGILDQLRQSNDQQTTTSLSAVEARADFTMLELVVIAGFGVVLAIAAGLLVARNVAGRAGVVERTVNELADNDATWLAEALEAMAAHDLTVELEAHIEELPHFGDDELGQIAAATNRLRKKIAATIVSYGRARGGMQTIVGQIQAAAGDVAQTSGRLEAVTGQTGAAVAHVNDAVQNVAAGAQDTSRSTQNTYAAVDQLRQAIDSIARGAGEQAREIQSTSSTAARMAAGVQEMSASAHGVAVASQQTRASAQHGAEAVRETVLGMSEIKQVVMQAADKVQDLGKLGGRIGNVVETIDDIAEQTNLLALNAAIEAARAGEHGKGFAVVADEVRKLAERSSRETKQIADLIREIQDTTREAVGAMEAGATQVELGSAKADLAGQALSDILSAVDSTVQQVSEIADAAQNMASASRSVVDAMASISAVVEENTASTEEMAAQAGQVTSAIEGIAAVSEEQSASTDQVSSSTDQMSAQVADMADQASHLATTAERLRSLVTQFKLDADVGVVQQAKGPKPVRALRRAA